MTASIPSPTVRPPNLAALLDAPPIIWQVDLVEILALERQVRRSQSDYTVSLDTGIEREIYLTDIPLALAKADLEAVHGALIENLMHAFPIEPGPYTAQLRANGRPLVFPSRCAQSIEPRLHTSATLKSNTTEEGDPS